MVDKKLKAKALELLIRGWKVKDVAGLIGCTSECVCIWKRDPDFGGPIIEARLQALKEIEETQKAADKILEELLNSAV